MLLSLSITVLRQLGLFKSETADYQQRTHFPGTFVPFLLHRKETRTRFVFSLNHNPLLPIHFSSIYFHDEPLFSFLFAYLYTDWYVS